MAKDTLCIETLQEKSYMYSRVKVTHISFKTLIMYPLSEQIPSWLWFSMLSTATLLLILHYPGSFSIYAWMDNFQKDYPVFSVKLYRFRFYIDCKDYPFPLSSNSPEWFSVTLLSFIQPKDTCLRWVNSFGQENSSFEPQVLTCLPAC